LYKRLCGGEHLADLLWHLPADFIDRSYSPKLKYAEKDRVVTLTLSIAEHAPPKRPGLPYKIVGYDDTGQVEIIYFNAKGDYLGNLYPTDRPVVISGMLERFRGGWSMSHPDYALPPERAGEIPKLDPIYPLTEGLSNKLVRKTIQFALSKAPDLPEWNDEHLLKRENWASWKNSIEAAHDPTKGNFSAAKRRLAYDELLADQLALAIIRRHHREAKGKVIEGNGAKRKLLESSLPFSLTEGQKKALAEISSDMASPQRMLRLLQGDVGSGKTIVALFAMLQAVEAGMQAAIMAPTEILAKQHYERINSFLEKTGMEAGLLTGKTPQKERKEILRNLENGSMQIIVGTHALFQDDVKFSRLGLAVVDEQHRFGVQQRLKLANKSQGVDILVMTATPIPRTLALTAYGDMDISRIEDKPANRLPIDTRLVDMSRIDEVIEGIKRQIAKNAQIYWVCPLVEESEKLDLAAATERAAMLKEKLGSENVGLIHGRMQSDEKDRVMESFSSGAIKLLVATTVIEVGVDVPNATLMIVEHSERFGLAQLHQIRGRVGRGTEKSACLLMYQSPLGDTAKERLKTIKGTEDGFLIAEKDLSLRGAGEILGNRQSGIREFRIADIVSNRDLLAMACDDAKLILSRDPDLSSERGNALRTLLYLFNKDAAVGLFKAG
jgi:ATP-dependent DNA helicase RecG